MGNTYNKLIDADEAFRVLSDYYHHRTEVQHDALREALDRVPEAVVRCKDCKYLVKSEDVCKLLSNNYEPCVYAEPDGYCSYGERGSDDK